ncbi:hypothetical protein ACFQZE_14380 [Paenibacillus sp. GCM10027627]|uniref:hypothetical protein n=1 Tax=unclassified Paenibacillus TaxID=185978 RepID=UPI003625C90F
MKVCGIFNLASKKQLDEIKENYKQLKKQIEEEKKAKTNDQPPNASDGRLEEGRQ